MCLFDLIRRRVVLFDGAMGTMCQRRGLPSAKPPEWYSLTHPERIKRIHGEYAEAGATVLTTNTLGGNRVKLSEWNIDDRLEEINSLGVRLAKEMAGANRYVAASVGPIGKMIEPLGDLSFDDACQIFAQQVQIFEKESVDLILVETMSDLQEARAAVLAARENSGLPVLVSFAFEPTCHTVSGDSPEAIAVVMEALGVDGIGVNCVGDLDLLLKVVARMAGATHLPLLAQPNAGRPELVSGKTVFRLKPEELANRVDGLIESGVNLIGGCCGTTPEHIRALCRSISGRAPRKRTKKRLTRFASRSRVVELDKYPCVIGELINPSGRKELKEDLKNGRASVSKNLAVMQSRAGSDLLDVNVAIAGADERSSMARVVKALSLTVQTPLAIDSSSFEVLEEGLRAFPGKALMNSTTGEEKKLRVLLPLAKKYGAAIIGLTMDENGIPAKAEGCLKIARKILDSAKREGIERTDVIIDPLVLSAGAEPERVGETLRALELVRNRLKLRTVLGISNVSYGLPKRSSISAAFLTMAVHYGVDIVIINPLDEQISQSLAAASLLTQRGRGEKKVVPDAIETTLPLREQLKRAILIGDPDKSRSTTLELLESKDPQSLLNTVVLPALEEIGERFSKREIYLPQLILSSDAAKKAVLQIKKEMERGKVEFQHKGKLVFATVRGDLHDIGKNIVIAVLENYGYDVVDLGKDIPNEKIIECAEREEADLICLSSLMTTTMKEMGRLMEDLSGKNLHFRVLVGGAVVTPDYAASIGASYAQDAQEAVKEVKQLIEKR